MYRFKANIPEPGAPKHSLFFLNFNFKILAAFGAAYGMLALSVGQAQGRFAVGAFAVAVGFALGEFSLLQGKFAPDLSGQRQIFSVFRPALIEIAGKGPPKEQDHQRQCQEGKNIDKEPQHNADQITPK